MRLRQWPPRYLALEAEFCAKELLRWMESENPPEQEAARQEVLLRRKIFKLLFFTHYPGTIPQNHLPTIPKKESK